MRKLWRFFFPENKAVSSYGGKIEVFSRHCIFSSISAHKKRLSGFSRELCYKNLIQTIDRDKANLTFFIDLADKSRDGHFLKEEAIEVREGSEAGSFLRLLVYVSKLKLHPETILYFVEDDYLHRPGWVDILKEGFEIPGVDYVTLYDHKDKYFFPLYDSLKSKIFITKSTHWRTTPSTTQTFATKFKTLMRDLSIHRRYSLNRKISKDHEKFSYLGKKGAILISPIPGWSTHAEPDFASPLFDWEKFLKGDPHVCENSSIRK